ncbi:solute carrier organic anion transporter family member 1B3-like isoform X2 [Notamacropus eugenii]|uniref:solute carrier organic anion transporter family member 1B3-like isoform X2 n=1 Tax=Notamacropus eugenii TaxID=9315 RepID=UPI003B67F4DF
MSRETSFSDSKRNSTQHSAKQADTNSSVKKKIKCNNDLKIFVVALSLSFMCKYMSGIVMKTSMIYIERRFGTTSFEAGLIDGGFEIGNLLVITLVSHFGTKFHIPKLIGTGCLIMGIGSILSGLPHFFMGYYSYDTSSNFKPLENSTVTYTVCTTDENSEGNMASSVLPEPGCKNESGSHIWIYVLMGNVLRGIGEAPVTPLGIMYIDNFANKGHSAFYIGFLLTAFCGKMYVDIGYVDLSTIPIKSNDSRWVGAWWLSLLTSGILTIVAGIPFFFIPNNLKKRKLESKIEISLDTPNTKDSRCQNLEFQNPEQIKELKGLAGYFHSLKCLLSNWMYLVYLILTLLDFSSLVGYSTYLLKYLEQQHGISVSKLNIIFGIIMPIVGISFFMGGFISRKLRLSPIGKLKLLFISHTCAYILQVPYLLLGCESKPVAGLTVSYNGNDPGTAPQNITFSFCNSDCNCDANLWDPVCGDNGVTYMSPCLAGCQSSIGHGKDLVFHNCSCVGVSHVQSRNISALLGECSRTEDCSRKLIYFLVLNSFAFFSIGLGKSPELVLMFNNIEPELKSLAIGVHSLVMRAIGGILSPLCFGAVIDLTCLKWGSNHCGEQGACRIYDTVLFKNTFLGLYLGIKAPIFIFCIVLLIGMKKKYQENEWTFL